MFFVHSEPAQFFLSKLPFFFFPPVPLPPSAVKPAGRHHHRLRNLPLSPFPFPLYLSSFSFDITKREEGGGNGREPGPEGRRRGWLPLTAAAAEAKKIPI